MMCRVYRSDKKAETYLYLADGIGFEDLPPELQQHFGEPAFVIRLDLSSGRSLARVDAARVIRSLDEKGFFLQLPPELAVEEEISRWIS